jgi:hypothetical protein
MAVAAPPAERAAGRRSALKRGLALPPASPGAAPGFPVTDADHWDKAFQSVGRAGSPGRRAALGKLLRKTAGRFGKASRVKGSWLDKGGGGGHGKNMSNPLETAMTDRKLPVSGLSDIIVSRIRGGGAVIRHRNGGGEIAQLNRSEDGWVVTIDGQAMPARGHQRAALAQAIGLHNRAAGTPFHRATPPAADPLQGAPEQTDLMKQYGIPAIRALATPADSAGDGPRMTASGSGDSTGNGLGPRGKQIYAKLKAKGFPDARAMAFAKRAEAMIARNQGKLWPPRS